MGLVGNGALNVTSLKRWLEIAFLEVGPAFEVEAFLDFQPRHLAVQHSEQALHFPADLPRDLPRDLPWILWADFGCRSPEGLDEAGAVLVEFRCP